MTKRTKAADQALVEIPPGYSLNARGQWVPDERLTELDRACDRLATRLTRRCVGASRTLASLKVLCFADLDAHVVMVGAAFGVRLTGRSGGIVVVSKDGLSRVERVVSPRMRVGSAILAAEALLRECLDERLAIPNADPVLVAIVGQLVNRAEGCTIAPSRVLDFCRMEIPDPRWQRAQHAYRAALESDGSAVYFRAYTRTDPRAPWEQVPLDFSRFGPGDADPRVAAAQEAAL